jgi:hypothetical protein
MGKSSYIYNAMIPPFTRVFIRHSTLSIKAHVRLQVIWLVYAQVRYNASLNVPLV